MANTIPAEPSDELTERDLLFNAYFEDELDAEERAAFETRMDDDPAFAEAYHEFFRVMGGLRELPFQFAPDDFVDRVQSRIRTRSHGRFFAEEYLFTTRVPYEVVAIVMLVVMAGAYLFMGAPADRNMQDVRIEQTSPRLDTSLQRSK